MQTELNNIFLYKNYLLKHKTEPFVMLNEMNLSFPEFNLMLKTNYSFRKMWGPR